MEQALEKLLDNTFSLNITKDRMYQTIDTYARGTTQLYSFDPEKPFGLMDEQPFQHGYDFPETKTQFHFHGPDENHLTYGKLIDYDRNILFEEKNSFNLAMDDLRFDQGGFKKFP